MQLRELLQSIAPLNVSGTSELEIQDLCYDSRQARPGGLFFALRGAAVDGHRFLAAAVEAGATAVVVEDDSTVPAGVTCVTVADSRLAMSLMAAAFYGEPTARVPLVGITGTNGKTTTTYIVEAILEAAGIPAAVLGTVSYRFRDRTIPAPHTTPESVELQRILRQLVAEGARGVVMEVSSHALEQRRVDGCRFDVGVFTNLTRDHLDYHRDMENYLTSKLRLFSELLRPDATKARRCSVVNSDDPYAERFVAGSAAPVLTYGLGSGAQVTAREIDFSVDGIGALLVTPLGEVPFRSQLLGRFNLANILAAAAAGVALELPLAAIRAGIEGHHNVPGRLERVANNRGITLLVDYAHTGDALENVLRTLKELATARIITVFGCGGDRDRGKRPIMGEVAGRYSDLAVITSDNPRTEDPRAILAEVRSGILPLGLREYDAAEIGRDGSAGADKGFVVVENRREAIRLAVRAARPGDVVLLAGKGHEDYQIIGREKHHFDDREEAAAACREPER
ncbi:MAG TPA: UDP-N-acetylmuramoyl-L-alanyl-D-glutamate--2,6-diaminopimelate ligase [Geobacteraceae bacterium]